MHGKGRSTSVLVIGAAIFLILAFSIYIFRSFPYLLGLVLILEWIVLIGGVLGPLLVNRMTRSWFGGVVIGLLAVALANLFMLLLARRWNVEPTGWYAAGLHWQDSLVKLVLGVAGFVVGFLDALIKALFNLSQGPIQRFLDHLRWPTRLDLDVPPTGIQGLPDFQIESIKIGFWANLILGAVASLMAASVVKGLLPRARSSAGASARH